MRIRLLIGIGGTLFLLILLSVSVYVALKRQEIRPKAVNDVEFMQVTPSDRRKGGKGQVAVVLNQLDSQFQYRLAFDLTYAKNPDQPPTDDVTAPPSRNKTVKVQENKTYKYKFRADDCRFIANLDIQLYYRESKDAWIKVAAPTAQGQSKLQYSCQVIQVSETPPAVTADGSASASFMPNIEPSPVIIQPDDAAFSAPDPEATDIDTLDDESVLDEENNQSNPSPSGISVAPSIQPTPSTLSTTPSVTPAARQSPSPFLTSSPVASPANDGFGSLLTSNYNTQSVSTPVPRSTPLKSSSPSSSTSASLAPFTTQSSASPESAIASITPPPTDQDAGESGKTKTSIINATPGTTPVIQPVSTDEQGSNLWLWLLGGAAVVLTGIGIVLLL